MSLPGTQRTSRKIRQMRRESGYCGHRGLTGTLNRGSLIPKETEIGDGVWPRRRSVRRQKIPKETEISDAETLRTKATLSCYLPGLETRAPLRKAPTPRHFGYQPGKSPFGGTAWWSRQDSNLQPDRMQAVLSLLEK